MRSLYIHIPFCFKKCLFCSFAISVGAAHRADEYLAALEKEMLRYKNEKIDTIYFGGGTPNFLGIAQISRVINALKDNFDIADDASVSIELNPEGVSAGYTNDLKRLGFNRVSLGVQTWNDAYLNFLGRAHNSAMAHQAYRYLRDAGFKDINVDLMYGFPGQSRGELEVDLEVLAALGSQHVSIYTLTIEPNSRFHAKAVALDSDEKLADDYVFVTQFLESRGLKQYEVSNFAREGFASRHNLAYWQGKDYIGIGMAAHGLLSGRRYWNEATLPKYIDAVNAQGHAIAGEEFLSAQTRLSEDLIFGLRMNQGVVVNEIERKHGLVLTPVQQRTLQALIDEGFLQKDQQRILSTIKGRLVLDEIAVRLI